MLLRIESNRDDQLSHLVGWIIMLWNKFKWRKCFWTTLWDSILWIMWWNH